MLEGTSIIMKGQQIYTSLLCVALWGVVHGQDQHPFCNTPHPDCSGFEDSDLYVQDPKDCGNYFTCMNANTAIGPIACPHGQLFLKSMGDDGFHPPCTDGSTNCHQLCQCDQECIMQWQQMAAPHHCSQYYICVGGNTPGEFDKFLQDCPVDKPYFDGADCQTQEKFCCAL
ncbi:unnamed protein product [Meganyctiphanes norvegica]|uniref:Chitin-binding type-2 domain-containing protein n=1 Tax=Meganyctiphanes norvegica TaxID=48144 RepID=A0AAV2PYC9_MEGNR